MTERRLGPYRLDALLGRGGMGEVWRAVDTVRDRAVALKVLPDELSGAPDYPEIRARFRREARIAARLDNPHVVPIHDFGEIDSRLFIDMRLVEGTDLAAVIAREGRLAPGRAVGLIEQLADALDAAHSAGLVHRDVKPSNALVTSRPPTVGSAPYEFVYLADFGIVRALGAAATHATTGGVIGTLAYMAPERFGTVYDHRVDVYSLACVFYECLTGKQPFTAADQIGLIGAHLHMNPPQPQAVDPALAAFEAVIACGMAKDPEQRFRSAKEFAAATRAALDNSPAAALSLRPVLGASVIGTAQPTPTLHSAPLPLPLSEPSELATAARRRRRRAVTGGAAVLIMLATVLTIAIPGILRGAEPDPAPASIEPTLTGHTNRVYAVATTHLDGRPIAISGGDDRTLRMWDLATGQQIGQPLTGHTGSINGMATTQLDGRPIAISASGDNTLRIWNLTTGQPIGQPFTGHTLSIETVAATRLGDRPIAISGGSDNTLRMWDLASGQQIGQPLTGHTNRVDAVTTTQLDARPIAISGGADRSVRVWDLTTGQQIGQPLTGHTDVVRAVTTTQLDGRPIAISGSADGSLRIWDLTTSQQIGQPLTGHINYVTALASTELDGRPIAISASRDFTLRVWDLRSRARP